MLTVEKVHRLTGVSVRTLHHYDKIGLLKPCTVTAAGYRLYDSDSLEKLGQIMLFKELGFSLNDIKEILQNPNFDKNAALDRQIKILEIKKERIERIISFAEQIKKTGEFKMDFSVFDTKKAEEYQQLAKKEWGGTAEYKEYEQKTAGYSKEHHAALSGKLMDIFKVFGTLKNLSPGDTAVQEQVKTLQDFITQNYYTCNKTVLAGLGKMYAAGGEMTENINAAAGEGAAQFCAKAIEIYCK